MSGKNKIVVMSSFHAFSFSPTCLRHKSIAHYQQTLCYQLLSSLTNLTGCQSLVRNHNWRYILRRSFIFYRELCKIAILQRCFDSLLNIWKLYFCKSWRSYKNIYQNLEQDKTLLYFYIGSFSAINLYREITFKCANSSRVRRGKCLHSKQESNIANTVSLIYIYVLNFHC